MSNESEILAILEHLVISDKHTVASLMLHRFKEGTSSVNNVYKALTNLVGMGKLVKGDGYFKLPSCKSEYKEHAQLLTKALAEVLKLKLTTKIIREPTIPEIGLRPDAIIFITKEDKGLCFILEVCNNETQEYLTQKINAWKTWRGARDYLSKLFNVKVKDFDIVVDGGISDGAFEFQTYLKEVMSMNIVIG